MKEYIDYKVVSQKYLRDLCQEVKVYIANGWEPQGGVSSVWLDRASAEEYFYQAMVKKRAHASEEIGF